MTPTLDQLVATATAQEAADAYEARRDTRDALLRLKRIAGRVSRSRAVRDCLGSAKVIPGQLVFDPQVIAHVGAAEDGRAVAGYSGLMRCGLANLCPWCARKVREERAKRINDMVTPWLQAGGLAAFLVFTIAGRPKESIWAHKKAMSQVNAKYRILVRRDKILERAGAVGTISGWEFTVRLDGTGHPHRNEILLFTDIRAMDELRYRLPELWVEAARLCGRKATVARGLHVEFPEIDEATGSIRLLAAYNSKGAERWGAGQELTRADLKSTRSEDTFAPFDLLRAIEVDGDVGDTSPWVQAWRAYERACKGTAVARFSKGLEARLARVAETGRIDAENYYNQPDQGACDEDHSEADAIAEEIELVEEAPMVTAPVVAFGKRSWRYVHRNYLHSQVLRWLEDLFEWGRAEGVEVDYVEIVRSLLIDHGATEDELLDLVAPAEELTTGPFDD